MSQEDGPEIPGLIPPRPRVLSMNQVVSYNLMRARRLHMWSQQDVAELLEKYTGRPWSNASVSAAERAWQGGRSRRFDASEILALSKIFDEPLAYFFLPPDDYEADMVGMTEYKGGLPNTEIYDADNELMTLTPTADLVGNVAMREVPPPFIGRVQKLTHRLHELTWDPPKWQPFRRQDWVTPEEEVDWGEVQEFASEAAAASAEAMLTSEQISALIRKNAQEIAAEIVREITAKGLEFTRSTDDDESVASQDQADPPF